MKPQSYFLIVIGLVIFVLSFYGYVYFSQTIWFADFYAWAQSHLWVFLLVLLFLKILGTVYPPLPGAIFTLAAVPVVGWIPAYVIDLSGSIAAGAIDYWLGRRYGMPVIEKLFDPATVAKIKQMRIRPGREIESVIVLRVLLGGIILEAVYYGAGLLAVPFGKFIFGAAISHAVLGIPTFYLGEAIFRGQNILVTSIAIVAALFVLYKVKGRYFE